MRSELINRRLKDLDKNIYRDWDLLKSYEEIYQYERDPRMLARYNLEIRRQRESIALYEQEYNDLKNQVMGEPTSEMRNVGIMLDKMDDKLDRIQKCQSDNLQEIEKLRNSVLSRFDLAELNIISEIVSKLDKSEVEAVQSVLVALEANRLPEIELNEALATVQRSFKEMSKQESSPLASVDAERISSVIENASLDSSQKLKVAIPLIPLILKYEAEFDLKCGVNLKSAWNKLTSKLRAER
jgi:hypothetical protein